MPKEGKILLTALAGVLLMLQTAVSAEHQQEAPVPSKGALERIDPSDFFTQFRIRNEYRFQQNGAEINLLRPRFDYAFSRRVQARVEVPLVYLNPAVPEIDRETGLGDILLSGAFRVARGKGYAVVAALELTLDTATDPLTGLGKYRLGPLIFASIEVPLLRSRLFPFYQHVFSFAGDGNRPDINYASIRPAVILTKWPNRWYTVIDPNFFIDFELDNKSGMTLEVEVGRALSKNVIVWGRPGIGVYGDIPQVYDWNFEAGFRYFFR
jgi:hypothetical protein